MTYIYKTMWSGSEIVAEYCYSSLHNKIKVVELTVDGKFHRTNWMGPNGRDKLMDELMSDYDKIMLGQQDPDYDSADLNGDGEINVLDIIQIVNIILDGRGADATESYLFESDGACFFLMEKTRVPHASTFLQHCTSKRCNIAKTRQAIWPRPCRGKQARRRCAT